MKKLITILAIMIVLVGAVFADTQENHKITIHAAIEELVPAFQLYYSANVLTNEAATIYSDDGGNAGTAFIDELPKATKYIDLEAGDSITFTVKLLNNAKIVKVYTANFSGGTFATTENGQSSPAVPSITTAGYADTTGVEVSGTNTESVTITFDGARCTAGDLLTVTYTYDPQPELDPIADITSDVIMQITTP